VDQLAWRLEEAAGAAVKECCAELEGMTHLHGRFDLHRLDVLLELSQGWKRLLSEGNFPLALLDLIPPSWNGAGAALRVPLQAGLVQVLANPGKGLALFDGLKIQTPLVFVQLSRLIEGMTYQSPARDDTSPPGEELGRWAARFVELMPSISVPPRLKLFRFCIHQFLPQEVALDAVERQPDCPGILRVFHTDEPLRLVCLAYRWLWG
jgi:hypothetical protein